MQSLLRRLTTFSGLELPRLPRGGSTPAVIGLATLAKVAKVAKAAANALPLDEVHALHLLAAATTPLAKTTAVNASTIVETDHAAPRTVTVT